MGRGGRLRAGWLLVALAACGGEAPKELPGDGTDACPADPSLALGTGLLPVTPLADGDALQMVHGPQGGWHIDTGGLLVFPTLEVAVSPRITLDDRVLAGDQPALFTVLADYDDASCEGLFYEVRAYVDDELPQLPAGTDVLRDYICPLAGAEVTVEVEVADLDRDTVVTDAVRGTLLLDPYDVSLCAGG